MNDCQDSGWPEQVIAADSPASAERNEARHPSTSDSTDYVGLRDLSNVRIAGPRDQPTVTGALVTEARAEAVSVVLSPGRGKSRGNSLARFRLAELIPSAIHGVYPRCNSAMLLKRKPDAETSPAELAYMYGACATLAEPTYLPVTAMKRKLRTFPRIISRVAASWCVSGCTSGPRRLSRSEQFKSPRFPVSLARRQKLSDPEKAGERSRIRFFSVVRKIQGTQRQTNSLRRSRWAGVTVYGAATRVHAPLASFPPPVCRPPCTGGTFYSRTSGRRRATCREHHTIATMSPRRTIIGTIVEVSHLERD